MARINIPTSPSDLIDLCVAIAKQHKKLGKSSPLSILEWEQLGPMIAQADALDDQVAEKSQELTQLTNQRNTFIEQTNGLGDFVRRSRDILGGVYLHDVKKLGDFGFEVSETPKNRKPAEVEQTTAGN